LFVSLAALSLFSCVSKQKLISVISYTHVRADPIGCAPLINFIFIYRVPIPGPGSKLVWQNLKHTRWFLSYKQPQIEIRQQP